MVKEKLESNCNEKGYKYPKAGDIGKTFTLKGLLELVHNIGSAKEKMLEANPNLERSMTVDHSVEKILRALCYTRRLALFKLLLIQLFLTKK